MATTAMRKTPHGGRGAAGFVGTLLLYAVWLVLIVGAPLLAAWVASSLAAYAGGSVPMAAVSGLLVFPVLPVLWEGYAALRRARRGAGRAHVLTLVDRLVLRTLVLSALFVGALVWARPRAVFEAINTRGDWVLDGRHDARSELVRRGLFTVAARARFIDRATDDNPFHENARPTPHPEDETWGVQVEAKPLPAETPSAPQVPTPPLAQAIPRDAREWPWPGTLHVAVNEIPAEVEQSPEAVGRYLAARVAEPWELTKAVHDYVADRIAYDVEAYRSGTYPPQDAQTTFRTRRSVCAGYAALFEAIGRAAGLTIETVGGRARDHDTVGMGEGHAWNAVKLGGQFYLVDTTWDAGYVNRKGFGKKYTTAYFLTSPEVFLATHFPDESSWQLLERPRSEGEYLRMPVLSPEFAAQGLSLQSPERAETDTHGGAEIVIANPRRVSILAATPTDPMGQCQTTDGEITRVRCAFVLPGPQTVVLLTAPRGQSTHWGVGGLRFVKR